MKQFAPIAFILALFAVLGIAGNADLEDQQAQDREYCELVALWKATPDGYVGIPPYRSDIDCVNIEGSK